MEQKEEKGLRIRSCLTGAIWLALVFSTVISALLFAILNHFFNLPGSIPVLGWLLIFNTLIAGLITSFCLLYTSPSPRDRQKSRMPSSA